MGKRGVKMQSTETWIEKARQVHGARYDYSLAEYRGGTQKVTIICSKHGPFQQTGSNHIYGRHGCRLCSKNTPTAAEFLIACYTKYGERYDYSLAHYVNMNSKIVIVCIEHGPFHQKPISHLMTANGGCWSCYLQSIKKYQAMWIAECAELHSNYYDYSEVDYQGRSVNVTIICPKHGKFEQRAGTHMSGHGCKRCRNKAAK